MTQAEVQATQLEIPTGCFFYGLWLGAKLLGVAKDSLKISESIKAIVFSYQRFLAKESYQTILASFLPRFVRVSDLAKSVFALIPNETSESLEAFCKSKFVEESTQKVDQMQLVFVELNNSWSKRSAEAFRQQSEANESALQDRFLRFEGSKDNRALFRETSSRSLHSDKILKAQQEREHRLNLSRLDQLILRIRCNESSAWFRESASHELSLFIENRVAFFECSEQIDREGGHSLMIPLYDGSSRQNARKRGGQHATPKQMDMKAMQSLYDQLHQSKTVLSEAEVSLLRTKVEMLLKQFANVSQQAEEKRRRTNSLIKGLFKNRRGSDVRTYRFQVSGIRFESADPLLDDLSFASFDALL